MARSASPQLTPLELDIMLVLWETGPANVQTVQENLVRERPLAYTSVQTMLNLLERKGKVKRALRDRAFFYRAVVSRERVTAGAVRELLDRFFGGSAEELVTELVRTRELSPKRLRRIQKHLKKGDGEGGE